MKTAEHIIETVDKLVRKYHTRDPYELCQLLGIKIHYYDLQKKLKGFFYYLGRVNSLFAGGELDEDAKDVFFQAIMSVYMDSKKTAREKYTPKKYRKHKDKE